MIYFARACAKRAACCVAPTESTRPSKVHLWGGEIRARSSDLEPTDNPDPAARTGSRNRSRPPANGSETENVLLVQDASDPGAPYAAPGAAPAAHKDAPVIQRRFPQWEVVRWLDAKVPWPYPADGAADFVAACLAEMARARSSHWAIVPRKGPADLIGIISLWPDDGRPRPARLLARPRLPRPGADDRGGRPGDRLRLPASSAGPACGSATPRTTTPRAASRRSRAPSWSTS